MSHLKKHIFICENQREKNHPKGCCADKGGTALKHALKMQLAQKGLTKIYRANTAGCLDVCEHGSAIVIYPQDIWYGGVQLSDIEQIIEESILDDKVIERLIIPAKKQETENID